MNTKAQKHQDTKDFGMDHAPLSDQEEGSGQIIQEENQGFGFVP